MYIAPIHAVLCDYSKYVYRDGYGWFQAVSSASGAAIGSVLLAQDVKLLQNKQVTMYSV